MPFLASAQITQNLRGCVTDKMSKAPLPGVQIWIALENEKIGTTSNAQGYYLLENIPIGRHEVFFRMLGYEEARITNILITSGKEGKLDVSLEEQAFITEEVVINADIDSFSRSENEMITLSSRSFRVEETRRYASTRNDPARTASNFAGVMGNNDSRNDIIIRGNAPTGLLWRMEGMDIPNPNHFGALGATGGPISMLNNNVLDQSDFLSGAFPAQYGNALSGVFDLQMRSGNANKKEYTLQMGFNGFELGSEGRIPIGQRGSWLINYRYSTLEVFKTLGISFGTGTAVPKYQDLSFKIDLSGKTGRWVVFGVGGLSSVILNASDQDSTNLYAPKGTDLKYKTGAGFWGAHHTLFFSGNTYGKGAIGMSGGSVQTEVDTLDVLTKIPSPFYRDASTQSTLNTSYTIHHKISSKSNLTAGYYGTYLMYSLNEKIYEGNLQAFRNLRDAQGGSFLHRLFIQGLWKLHPHWKWTGGINTLLLGFQNRFAIEPRSSLSWNVHPRALLAVGLGVHHQIQPLLLYFNQTRQLEGTISETNKNLGFSRSLHSVLSFDYLPHKQWHTKGEVYIQRLTNIPVEKASSYFSMLNEGADFTTTNRDSLYNGGFGINYGFEWTIERYFHKNWYVLTTLSLYSAKYKGSNGILKNSLYNGGFVWNVLGGYEWNVGKKTSLALDMKTVWAGGRRYTPINLEESRLYNKEIRYEELSFSKQFPAYFRWDVKLTFRYNRPKSMHEWFIDIQNISNHKNIFLQRYDPGSERIETTYQLGRFPNINYRWQF